MFIWSYHETVAVIYNGNEFRSVTHSFQTRVLHEVALLVFCGILSSFLVWISLSVAVVIPRPESSLYVKRSVKRSSVRKLKLSTAFSLSAPANKDSKLFSESSIEVLTLKLLWVINSSDSKSLNIASLFLFHYEQDEQLKLTIKKPRNLRIPPVPAWSVEKQNKDEQ